jgi:hypothetical protein
MRVYQDFRAAMIHVNILGAFRQIGLTFHVVDNIIRGHFDTIYLRESPGLQDLWEINCPPENHSARPLNAQFGWINKRK